MLWGDIWTVARKELHETLFPAGKRQAGLVQALGYAGLMGLAPIMMGGGYLESWGALIFACFPILIVTSTVVDLFAGERERHTFETLLASRLPDRAILLGKLAAITVHAWGVALLSQLIAVVGINLIRIAGQGEGGLHFFPADIALSIVLLTLLTAGLAGGAGILVSLRTPTARQASQRMIVPMLLVLGIPGFLPLVLGQLVPLDVQVGFVQWASDGNEIVVVLAIAVLLLAADALVFAGALARFRRAQLILD
ncbi:MAG: ABC transporter permease [Anaerolineae bacterium]|nr:ABC transporter permease [Anaerolineae bacterium]